MCNSDPPLMWNIAAEISPNRRRTPAFFVGIFVQNAEKEKNAYAALCVVL